MEDKFNVSFNKPAGCGNILSFTQIDCEISEKMGTEVYISHATVTLNIDQGHL